MKKLLIVDDEYIVRLGLKTVVDWSRFGYTLAEAGNGKEAIELLEKNPVDVIMTDIKMPVMDGLELIRKVKEKRQKTQIIILSHYDEFSYAQEAIKLGAFRYILKSELTKTNLETVLKSLDVSSDDPMQAEQKTGWKEQWETVIETYMLATFLEPKDDSGRPETGAPLPEADPGTSEYAVFSVSCRTASLPNDAWEKFPKTITVLFEEVFGDVAGKGRYYNHNFHFIGIAPGTNAEKIHTACVQIVKNVRQYYDVLLFIGVSFGALSDWERLLREAHDARIGCFFSAKIFVALFNRTDASAKKSEKKSFVSYAKLVELIDANQKEAIFEYIQNIFQELRVSKNYAAVHETFLDFLSIGKFIHEKFHLEGKASLNENKFKLDAFFNMPFIGDAELYIYELYLSLLSTKQNGTASYSRIVKKCIDFIHSDYEHNIGLTEAAKNAGVSHSYLSFIFKQETGVNFNAALAQYRIEQAKKLLTATGLRIYEIAEKVGFSTPYYFSKVFKELSGYTCKEYRDKGGE
ncbi:MAG: response regulator [Spirochaetaceae bacterium]|nr:response regulator [Spirochaetaceae bacterium]